MTQFHKVYFKCLSSWWSCWTVSHPTTSPLRRWTMKSVMLNNCWPMSYISVNGTSQQDARVNIHSCHPYTGWRMSMADGSIYDFSAETLDGEQVPLSIYGGKVLLIVNVATFWGSTIEEVTLHWLHFEFSTLAVFTESVLFCIVFPQYHRLNALMEMFGDLNFTVLGFPCNQFGLQSPGRDL